MHVLFDSESYYPFHQVERNSFIQGEMYRTFWYFVWHQLFFECFYTWRSGKQAYMVFKSCKIYQNTIEFECRHLVADCFYSPRGCFLMVCLIFSRILWISGGKVWIYLSIVLYCIFISMSFPWNIESLSCHQILPRFEDFYLTIYVTFCIAWGEVKISLQLSV